MLRKVDRATSNRRSGKRRSQQRRDGDQCFEVNHRGRHSSVACAVYCKAVATKCRENLGGKRVAFIPRDSGIHTRELQKLKGYSVQKGVSLQTDCLMPLGGPCRVYDGSREQLRC
jgi:hypothetical protein